MEELHLEHHLKIFQMTGYVRSVDWVKMFLKS